jgi:hypothetical protein
MRCFARMKAYSIEVGNCSDIFDFVTAAKNTGWKITTRTRSFVCEEEFL